MNIKHQVFQLPEMYMKLTNRKRLAKLMLIQEVSQRELSRAAGWKSHSYLGRLLRGEATTLETDPALRIAHYLGVGVDDLFLTQMANSIEQSNTHRKSTAA